MYKFCPRCKIELNETRANDNVIVCSECGYTDQINQRRFHNHIQSRTIKIFIMVSVLMSLVYIHTIHWDKYSLEIIPIQVNEIIGATDHNDLVRHAEICKMRQKYSCMVQKYGLIVQMTPNNTEAMAQYARSLESTGRIKMAMTVYGQYFMRGGKSGDLAHNYAKLLDKYGQAADAKKYFEYALQLKPKIFQVTVTKDYVNFLINNNDLKKAKEVIMKVRKTGQNAPFFMESELKVIDKKLT